MLTTSWKDANPQSLKKSFQRTINIVCDDEAKNEKELNILENKDKIINEK